MRYEKIPQTSSWIIIAALLILISPLVGGVTGILENLQVISLTFLFLGIIFLVLALVGLKRGYVLAYRAGLTDERGNNVYARDTDPAHFWVTIGFVTVIGITSIVIGCLKIF